MPALAKLSRPRHAAGAIASPPASRFATRASGAAGRARSCQLRSRRSSAPGHAAVRDRDRRVRRRARRRPRRRTRRFAFVVNTPSSFWTIAEAGRAQGGGRARRRGRLPDAADRLGRRAAADPRGPARARRRRHRDLADRPRQHDRAARSGGRAHAARHPRLRRARLEAGCLHRHRQRRGRPRRRRRDREGAARRAARSSSSSAGSTRRTRASESRESRRRWRSPRVTILDVRARPGRSGARAGERRGDAGRAPRRRRNGRALGLQRPGDPPGRARRRQGRRGRRSSASTRTAPRSTASPRARIAATVVQRPFEFGYRSIRLLDRPRGARHRGDPAGRHHRHRCRGGRLATTSPPSAPSSTAPAMTTRSATASSRPASLRKAFGGVRALDAASASRSHGGEVVALVGENGAGKSTLIKILAGIIGPTRARCGSTAVELQPSQAPAEAMASGIAVIHQELMLADNLSVAANLFLGREPLRWPALGLDRPEATRRRGAGARWRGWGSICDPRARGGNARAGGAPAGRDRARAAAGRPLRGDGRADARRSIGTRANRLLELIDELRRAASACSTCRIASTRSCASPIARWCCATARVAGELARGEIDPRRWCG